MAESTMGILAKMNRNDFNNALVIAMRNLNCEVRHHFQAINGSRWDGIKLEASPPLFCYLTKDGEMQAFAVGTWQALR